MTFNMSNMVSDTNI